jgi:cytoskeletal protein CcmA (bactofilin family)
MLKQIIGQTIGATEREISRPESTPAPLAVAPERAPILSNPAAVQPPRPSYSTPQMMSSSSSKNVLANDVEIKGSIKFSHDLIIDGKIEGEVHSDGSLTVGENALIKGEIKTRSVTIFGKVEGNITVQERCELKTNAVLVGDIAAGTLAIEEGATFMGQSQVGKRPDAKASASPSALSAGASHKAQ